MKNKKNRVFILIIVIIGAIVTYNYIYKDHRIIENEISAYSVTANNISNNFISEPEKSQLKYLNKTIEVTGKITEINTTDLTLSNRVVCNFNASLNKELQLGQEVKVKGRCIGFDDLLEQVKLDQSTIVYD